MDSSDSNPGEASERPSAGDISASDTPTSEATASGEASSHAEAANGTPRPRRRRRRRRRPGEAGAAPVAGGGENASSDGQGADDTGEIQAGETQAGEPGVTPEGGGEGGDRPILRLRNRRRRHRRPPGSAAPETAAGASDVTTEAEGGQPAPEAAGSDNPDAGAAGAETGEEATRPLGTRPPRSRNRRRHRPPIVVAKTAEGEVELRGLGAPPAERGSARPPGAPQSRSRRPPGDRPAAGPEATPGGGAADAAGQDGRRDTGDGQGRRDSRGRGDHRRDGQSGGGRPGGGRREGSPGRGRGPAPRPVERKLYALDAVVDRGFEDVEEEDGSSRRVNWTIVKRTTADQITRKPVATVYVLQREGVDAEFPSLGAARSAVNKTIVHPEKLTLSRAEHLAAKK